MPAEVFEWEIHGYFRYPIVSKLTVTNRFSGVVETIFEYAEISNKEIKAIRVLRNKKVVFHVERFKDKWIRLI